MENTKNNKSSKRLVFKLGVLVIFMTAFGYALVPLYDVLCSTLGINGKTENQSITATKPVDNTRNITVEFFTIKNASLPWEFRPSVKKIVMHPGESKQLTYYAKNTTDKNIVIQAIPSVAPNKYAKYVKKTECFCFEQQKFKPHESMDMPLIFHIDRDIPKSVKRLTLSYTLFDAGKFAKI